MTRATWLEDEDGYPWTSHIPFWLVALCIATSQTLLFALALYVSLWIFKKGGRWSLPGFLLATVIALFDMAAYAWHPHQQIGPWLDRLTIASFIAATFLLRHEILQLYREYGQREIKVRRRFTLLFSVAYLNYSVNPIWVPFGSFNTRVPDTVVSLDLNGSQSEKIRG